MSIRLQNATPENEKSEVICFLYDAETLERKICLILLIIYHLQKNIYNHLLKGIIFLPNQKKIDPWNFPFRW